jgi:hypothetical protein
MVNPSRNLKISRNYLKDKILKVKTLTSIEKNNSKSELPDIYGIKAVNYVPSL